MRFDLQHQPKVILFYKIILQSPEKAHTGGRYSGFLDSGSLPAISVTRGFRSKSARKKLKIRKLLNKAPQKSAIFADLLNKNFKNFPQETFKMRRFCGKPQSLVTLPAMHPPLPFPFRRSSPFLDSWLRSLRYALGSGPDKISCSAETPGGGEKENPP